jgi:hypothetical protein
MAADTNKSQSLTNLDSTPFVPNSAGQGAAGRYAEVDDVCAATATGVGTTTSTYKLVRIPTGAIPKSVQLATDVALDTGTHALVFDINLIFSDSTIDGTPAALQGLIPTTANNGSVTTIASYSSPNKIFGTVNNTSASVALAPTNVTLNGSRTNYPLVNLVQQPLWQTFGFVDGRGNPADPGGYFDLMLYVSTGAGTGAAGNIWGKIDYVF